MKLYESATLKAFLARHGITATKGLGQHFLCAQRPVESIANALAGCLGVCEIGPGPGVLTAPLSEQCDRLIALELDQRMIDALIESAPRADVRKADALTVNLDSILAELPEPRGVVSNLPYYITGPLLTKIAESRKSFSIAVLMMQKEVAQRVNARPGNSDRGSLSVYLQSQFEIVVVAQVAASEFVPPPKVDSTVLSFVPKDLALDPDLHGAFFRLVRFGFTQPRKTLANNLVAAYKQPRENLVEILEAIGLEEKVRPHDLTLEQWILLCQSMSLNLAT